MPETRSAIPAAVALRDVDLTDLDRFAANQAWGQFDVLRAEAPVFWQPEPAPASGFWAVTRYEDVVTVDKDPETYSSAHFVNLEEVDDDLQDLRRSLLETDGLRHRALRKLIHRDFGRIPLTRNYEDFLRGLTRSTVDAALPQGEFDFVTEISADFPIQVLARLLDVPGEDTDQLIHWGNQMIGNTDPDYAEYLLDDPGSDQYRHLPFRSPAAIEVFEYGRELARRRKGGDGTDLISVLVNRMPVDGEPLTATDFDNYFLLLVVAGNETTRHTISQAMLALIENPDQLALLQARPDLIPNAVEEFLRWASPVYHFRRTATRDTELGGQQIAAGDKVVMWFASANRDADVFADPYRFDVTRQSNDHLAFGGFGPHTCLGNNLAKMEVRLMFEELIPRLGHVEPAGDITRVRSNFVNGIKKFPIRVRPA